MSENTKALRVRIKSVTSTMQLTNAMGLVASSKIRKASAAMLAGREYASALSLAMSALTADGECRKSPYMQKRDGGRTRLIVIAGDRGLAGGYNANVFRLMAEYPEAEILPIGKRAGEKVGKDYPSSERFSYGDAAALADTLCRDFKAGAYDRLGILYTRYHSVMSQEAAVQWILPLADPEEKGATGMVFEPDSRTVLETAIREYVAGLITVFVRESFSSEVAARRMAMDSASKNAEEMIGELQLRYNRARQGAITQEITEIIAGSGS